ncbi:Uncharacterized protein APZ42_026412 [Daphnia magna]|uniref:Uncharacterized protein n=1 Tax=Daphnia magna TaxID=35525 RepID=A0A164S675_9CRUS|nr:Uncharacterized protein APZ42_026412 [Daphnia magna]
MEQKLTTACRVVPMMINNRELENLRQFRMPKLPPSPSNSFGLHRVMRWRPWNESTTSNFYSYAVSAAGELDRWNKEMNVEEREISRPIVKPAIVSMVADAVKWNNSRRITTTSASGTKNNQTKLLNVDFLST